MGERLGCPFLFAKKAGHNPLINCFCQFLAIMQDEIIIEKINQFNENIIEILTSNRPNHFEKYFFIKQEFTKNNINDEFKKSFCFFYKLDGPGGLNQFQKVEFFSLLLKKEKDLKTVLTALYGVLGNGNRQSLYLSFSSKLIHTLNNNLPIYDKNIAHILNLPRQISCPSLEKKLENRVHIYTELKKRFHSLLSNNQVLAMLRENRILLASLSNFNWQDDLISDTKLLDSILWALYVIKIKNLTK